MNFHVYVVEFVHLSFEDIELFVLLYVLLLKRKA